jgi:hypothetical protein
MRGRALLLGALLLYAGCVKSWRPLSEVADRVIGSCKNQQCALKTPQHTCLVELRANVAASVAKVPDSCATWGKP